MAGERPHRGNVELVDFGPDIPHIIWHRLTGEAKRLAVRSELCFDQRGIGYVHAEGDANGAREWINSFLDMSMHIDLDDATGQQECEFVHEKSTDSSTYVEELSTELEAKVMSHSCPWGSFQSEIYRHKLPKPGVWLRVFWTTPWVQSAVFGSECNSRWACRNRTSWIKTLECES